MVILGKGTLLIIMFPSWFWKVRRLIVHQSLWVPYVLNKVISHALLFDFFASQGHSRWESVPADMVWEVGNPNQSQTERWETNNLQSHLSALTKPYMCVFRFWETISQIKKNHYGDRKDHNNLSGSQVNVIQTLQK